MTEYQICPKCNGQGIVSKPPWVAGDVPQWASTSTQMYTCNVCDGHKIIAIGLLTLPDYILNPQRNIF